MVSLLSDGMDTHVAAQADVHVRVLIDVRYISNGVDGDDISDTVKRLIERAIGNGALTGDSPVEVDEHELTVRLISPEADAVDEKSVGDWLQARVDSGNLNPEEMIDMMARYALEESDAMREEFAERLGQEGGADGPAAELLVPPVQATVWSDDRNLEATFDAAPWFAQATPEDVLALAAIGWRGDQQADVVAEHVAQLNAEVRAVFDYVGMLPTKLEIGFECEVEEDDARAWLQMHNRNLWARVLCQQFDVRLVQAEEPEVLGRWDWLDHQGNASDSSFETIEGAALDAVVKLGLEWRAAGGKDA